jgi:phosphotransferase system enzyme I (PtsI)
VKSKPVTATDTKRRWRGIAAAPGIAVGPAFVYRVSRAEPHRRSLRDDRAVHDEMKRLDRSLKAVREDLLRLKSEAGTSVESALAKIFDAQVMIVDDNAIVGDVKSVIEQERIGAENAFARVVGQAQESVEHASDPYLREMANDIRSVKKRVVNHLLGLPETSLSEFTEPVIVLAANITPSDIVSLKRDMVLGIVTETGGVTSHTALLAKSFNIPAVVGVDFDVREIRSGSRVAIDGFSGTFILEPDAGTVEFFERKKRRTSSPWPKKYENIRSLPAVTRDNHKIALLANIDLAGEAAVIPKAGADGVGLYRTEYLFLARGGYPSTREQTEAYNAAVKAVDGRRLVVRTFDLGSDKAAPDAPPEPNPALGLRGIRLSLDNPRSLEGQFKALLAASAHGEIWIMLPMISSIDEVRRARRYLDTARASLASRGVPFDVDAPLGIMIETPAAVMLAADLAEEVDFFSIGTNDLLQYTVAADRGSSRIARKNQYWHPALWRQIAAVVKAAHKAKRPVGLCGEMANDLSAVPFLLGLGLDSISSHPNSVPKIKALIRSLRYVDAKKAAQELLELPDLTSLRRHAADFVTRHKAALKH